MLFNNFISNLESGMYISRFVGNVKQKGELDVLEGVTAILREFSKMEEHLIKTS